MASVDADGPYRIQRTARLAGSARVLVDGRIAHPAFAEGVQSALMRPGRFALPAAAVP